MPINTGNASIYGKFREKSWLLQFIVNWCSLLLKWCSKWCSSWGWIARYQRKKNNVRVLVCRYEYTGVFCKCININNNKIF